MWCEILQLGTEQVAGWQSHFYAKNYLNRIRGVNVFGRRLVMDKMLYLLGEGWEKVPEVQDQCVGMSLVFLSTICPILVVSDHSEQLLPKLVTHTEVQACLARGQCWEGEGTSWAPQYTAPSPQSCSLTPERCVRTHKESNNGKYYNLLCT